MGKGEETRTTILNAALAEASRSGLEALSIGGLAKSVGLSKSGLFAHFASKEDLQLHVLRTAVAHFIGAVIAPALLQPRGEPRLRALFDNWLSWCSDTHCVPGGCVFIGAANELDDQPGVLRDYLVEQQSDWLAMLARAASIAAEAGHLRADLDADQFAYDFYAIILAHHHFTRLLRDPQASARAQRSFEHLLALSRP